MVVYNCYIYNKNGECIFYRDWLSHDSAPSTSGFFPSRPFRLSTITGGASGGAGTPSTPLSASSQIFERRTKKDLQKLESDQKLMYGLIYSLKTFVKGIAPKEGETFQSFNTSTYKLHFFESPTGFKFIFLTDTNAGDLDSHLVEIYTKFFVPFVISNPLYELHKKVNCYLFTENLDRYVMQYMQ